MRRHRVSNAVKGALRVPAAVAPIKITADLQAGLIHCNGHRARPPRQLAHPPAQNRPRAPVHRGLHRLAARPRTRPDHHPGPVRPQILFDETGHELRSFTLSLSGNAQDQHRGQGHGSFVNSVLTAVGNSL